MGCLLDERTRNCCGDAYMCCELDGEELTSFSLQCCGLLQLSDGQCLALQVLLRLTADTGLSPILEIACIRSDGTVAASLSREWCTCQALIAQLVHELQQWKSLSLKGGVHPDGPAKDGTLSNALAAWRAYTWKKSRGHTHTLWATRLLERHKIRRCWHAWRMEQLQTRAGKATRANSEEQTAARALAEGALSASNVAMAELMDRQQRLESDVAAAIKGREELATELASAQVEIQHKQGKITALSTENDYLRQHLAERETMLRKANDAAERAADEQASLVAQLMDLRLAAGNAQPSGAHLHFSPECGDGRASSDVGRPHVLTPHRRELQIAQLEEEVAHRQAEVAGLQRKLEKANARAEAAEVQAKEDMAAADTLARFLTGVMAQLGVREDGRAVDVCRSAGGKAEIAAAGLAAIHALGSSRLGQLLKESYPLPATTPTDNPSRIANLPAATRALPKKVARGPSQGDAKVGQTLGARPTQAAAAKTSSTKPGGKVTSTVGSRDVARLKRTAAAPGQTMGNSWHTTLAVPLDFSPTLQGEADAVGHRPVRQPNMQLMEDGKGVKRRLPMGTLSGTGNAGMSAVTSASERIAGGAVRNSAAERGRSTVLRHGGSGEAAVKETLFRVPNGAKAQARQSAREVQGYGLGHGGDREPTLGDLGFDGEICMGIEWAEEVLGRANVGAVRDERLSAVPQTADEWTPRDGSAAALASTSEEDEEDLGMHTIYDAATNQPYSLSKLM